MSVTRSLDQCAERKHNSLSTTMDTQNDSIDISQLKDFASKIPQIHVSISLHANACHLGYARKLTPCTLQSRERQLSPPNAISREPQPERPGSELNNGTHAGQPDPRPTPTATASHNQPRQGSVPQSRTNDSENLATRHPVSQNSLPSTIPDSARARMLASGSQSQGDTQPVSPSVYDEYNDRSKRQRTMRESSGLDNTTSNSQEDLPHTMLPGDSGHIDLLAGFEPPSIEDERDNEEADDDVDPLSQSQNIRAEIYPEAKRFQAPKTPASHGRKRKRAIETSSPDQQTPKLPINPFAGQMGSAGMFLNGSQLFNTTQAHTSPMTNMVPSDGLSERPSPDTHDLQRPSTAGTPSSPMREPYPGTARATTEPQTVYITMKESQEARERQLRLLKEQQITSPGEPWDDDFADDTQLRRRLRQHEYNMEAKNQLAGIPASSEVAGRGRASGRGARMGLTPTRTSPRKIGTQVNEPVIISDDGPAGDYEGNITEDETEREEEAESEEEDDIDELAEENKENVEVPRTGSRIHHTSQVISSQPTPSHRRMRKPKGGSQAPRVVQVENSSQVSRSQPHPLDDGNEHGTEPEAIADSQPSHLRVNPDSMLPRLGTRAFSEPRSSLDSRILVPQSQLSQGFRIVPSAESKASDNIMKSSSQPASSSPAKQLTTADIENSESHSSKMIVKVAGEVEVTGQVALHKEGSNSDTLAHEGTLELQSSTVQPQQSISDDLAHETKSNRDTSTARDRNIARSTAESSNAMPSPRTTPKSASKAPSSHSLPEQSRPSTLFETAQEQLGSSPSRSRPQRTMHKSPSKQFSPRKSQRLRTMEEIAADPSPQDVTGDVDVDINILSSDDIDFQNAIHPASPVQSRKNRKGGRGQSIRVKVPEAIVLPALPGTPLPPPSSAISKLTPVPSSSPPIHARSPASSKIASRHINKEAPQPQKPLMEMRVHNAPSENAPSMPNQAQPGAKPAISKKAPAVPITKPKGVTSTTMPPGTDDTNEQVTSSPVSERPIVAPNRVFAHFNGSNSAYHPATCLEVIGGGGEEPRYSVRFDDGTVDTISAYGIKALELRKGDIIKLDLPGARTKNYIVEGMQDEQRPSTPPDPDTPSRRGKKPSTGDSAFPETDVYGFATVLASPKQRTSMDGKQEEGGQIAVPLSQIYFTQTLWTAFKNRPYSHVSNKLHILTGLRTPSERPSTPSTPASRTRRMKSSFLAQSRSTATNTRATEKIFQNMAFAITNVDRAEDSKRVKGSILSNGGTILDSGFDELFNIPTLNRTSSPKKDTDHTFHLTPEAQDTGFTCLIADKHCRRAKFVQALALGIPCLHTRWISDCVAKQRIVPWAPYLLPSGESSFLGGAVRSRNMQPYAADEARLSDIVDSRPRLLDGASVLLIMEKSQEETMKQHPLISHALGASKITRAINEDAAAKAVADAQALNEPWDWVFSYDKEKEVEKRLFGGSSMGKKRKRGRESEVLDLPNKKGKTKVVGNEFVIQSLILGMLVDD